jgi:hypothetical protein
LIPPRPNKAGKPKREIFQRIFAHGIIWGRGKLLWHHPHWLLLWPPFIVI